MLLIKCIQSNLRIFVLKITTRNISYVGTERKFRKAGDEKEEKRLIGWLLLMFPVTTFALGTWQVKRKFWKRDLITKIEEHINLEPVDLPADLSHLPDKEYRPYRVKGTFLHEKEIFLGPRQMITENDAKDSSMKKFAPPPGSGYLVITPFQLSDRDLTILVNRGWVPMNYKSPVTRKSGQIEGEIELVGVLRLTENLSSFGVQNAPESGLWLYRDLNAMSEATGSSSVFLDAVRKETVPGGPVAGQTNLSIRDQHLTYIVTWYGLAVSTLYMWFQKYGHYLRYK